MARPQSPLVGYNTNVRHKGRLYHIQTEDSGVNHPHVITHLFADGGRIIASRKTSYADQLGVDDLPTLVRKLMQEQHKAVFIELRDCVYDEDEDEPTQPLAEAAAAAKAAAQAGLAEAAPAGGTGSATPAEEIPAAAPPVSPPMPAASVDVAALEAAAAARVAESVAERARSMTPKRGAGRYQQTVPAERRARARSDTRTKKSIFGGELLQGKSLDEVILSYLSDDLGEG